SEVNQVRTSRDQTQRDHLAAVRRVAELQAQRQRTEQQIADTARSLKHLKSRLETATRLRDQSQAEVEQASQTLADLDDQIADANKQAELADAKVQETRRTLERRRDEVSALRIRLQGVTERFNVLQDLDRRQEGLSGGVRAVLKELSDSENPLAEDLVGIVADCLRVDVQVAPLIDAALGERSQFLIVRTGQLQGAIVRKTLAVTSRVGLIRIDELPSRRPGDRIRLDGLRGVIGRADRMIQCDVDLQSLAKHLLGNTWLVDSLSTALGLRKLNGAGLRFVTSAGELLETDGSTVVGPASASTGLVSRRSELQAAEKEISHYTFQLEASEEEAERISQLLDQQAAELGRHEQLHRGLITRRAAAEAELRHVQQQHSSHQLAHDELADELNSIDAQRQAALGEDRSLLKQINAGRHQIETLELSAAEIDESLSQSQTALQDATDAVMSVSVDVARAEQKYEALEATLQQQRRDQSQRDAAVAEVRGQAGQGRRRLAELTQRMLDATDRLADAHWQSEQCDSELAQLAGESNVVREDTREARKAADKAMKQASAASQAVHSITASRDNAKLRRDTLADRLLEDYEIDLRGSEPPDDLQPPDDREAVDEEIARLRGQLQKTGSVNMEALEELEDLQQRYDELHGQYQDLTAAKDSLQRIIGRINADSRRLFLDTLEAIRQNFQKLYRKSFGGGHADLILEDSDDPLEAGVDIVATPPGKPSFSNSLLSGGEKALTAVALLMAIFQYRPSPFCVLDEVDAPFDEANIGRFVTVLREFLDQSKFVVVTHSKKTMTAATTLYGVTMQESGVSKQVSIRFEDVSEDGSINSEGEAA
ncbi:MAG: chromosome segregation protein SMC, partial [Planctomycetota bacterium]